MKLVLADYIKITILCRRSDTSVNMGTDPPIATLKQTIFCVPSDTENFIKLPGTQKVLGIPICCTFLTITCTLFSERPTNVSLFLVM